MSKQDRISTAILGIALYLIATGLTFGVLTLTAKKSAPDTVAPPDTADGNGGLVINPSTPRTDPCPLNGQLYTTEERKIWEARRPLAIMVENHVDSRPHSGLVAADIVYEAVSEGGVTRFMGIFYCGVSAKNTVIAPVRSARTPFLPWVLEYDAPYIHVGGAGNCNDESVDPRAKSLCQIDQYKIKDMDQFGLPFTIKEESGKKQYVCKRNYERLGREIATEHTMECFTNGLYLFAARERNWTNIDAKGISWDKNFVSWKFKDDVGQSERGTASAVSFVAWKGYEKDFGVRWVYDPAANFYNRVMGGLPHTDLETKAQVSAKNVIIQFAREIGPVDDHGHILYENTGSGEGRLFQDGIEIKITWKKPKRTDRTIFYDVQGTEVKLNRGPIWIEILPTGAKVEVS